MDSILIRVIIEIFQCIAVNIFGIIYIYKCTGDKKNNLPVKTGPFHFFILPRQKPQGDWFFKEIDVFEY